MAVLAYQSYFWLRQGYWRPVESRLVLDRVLPSSFFQWLGNTNSWSGLNRIISAVFTWPLALFLFVFGMVVFLLIAKTLDLFSKPVKPAEKERTKHWRGT
jgi:hypothetical protein